MNETALEMLLRWLDKLAVEEQLAKGLVDEKSSFAAGIKFGIETMQGRIKFTLKQYRQFAEFEKELEEIRAQYA